MRNGPVVAAEGDRARDGGSVQRYLQAAGRADALAGGAAGGGVLVARHGSGVQDIALHLGVFDGDGGRRARALRAGAAIGVVDELHDAVRAAAAEDGVGIAFVHAAHSAELGVHIVKIDAPALRELRVDGVGAVEVDGAVVKGDGVRRVAQHDARLAHMELRIDEGDLAAAVARMGHDAVFAGIDHAGVVGHDAAARLHRRVVGHVDDGIDEIIPGAAVGVSSVAAGEDGDVAVIHMQLRGIVPVGVKVVAVSAQRAPALGDDHGIVIGDVGGAHRVRCADLSLQEEAGRAALHGKEIRIGNGVEGGAVHRDIRSETGEQGAASGAAGDDAEVVKLRDRVVGHVDRRTEAAHIVRADACKVDDIVAQDHRLGRGEAEVGVTGGAAAVHEGLGDLIEAHPRVIAQGCAEGFPVGIVGACDIGEVDLLRHQSGIRAASQDEGACVPDGDADGVVLRRGDVGGAVPDLDAVPGRVDLVRRAAVIGLGGDGLEALDLSHGHAVEFNGLCGIGRRGVRDGGLGRSAGAGAARGFSGGQRRRTEAQAQHKAQKEAECFLHADSLLYNIRAHKPRPLLKNYNTFISLLSMPRGKQVY